ncbi:MAG TPA: GIY-YIG nuclease family protein [Candidatus Thermoplasmatota archaeon]|nr:GIY-YIG nuclease family protein [Candidatus Thermoplasmatota archaeon]
MKGAYLLLLDLPRDTRIIVGKQGMKEFKKGSYAYVGSALNGLEQRICRHLRSQKKVHWHIDYLLAHATITSVFIKESTKREECDLASSFALSFETIPGFGCSDCACESHLFFGSSDALMKRAAILKMHPYPFDANP